MRAKLAKLRAELLCRMGRHELESYARCRLGLRYFHAANCYRSDYCRGRIHYYSEDGTR